MKENFTSMPLRRFFSKRTFLVVSLLMVMGSVLKAQVTTSAMSGKITDNTDTELIGATVIAVHEPSGTAYNATSNIDGVFNIQGMRTGGPYKLSISYIGFVTVDLSNIYLSLGNTFSKNIVMREDNQLLGEVVVIAEAKAKNGASQNFGSEMIELSPTVDRNVYDVVKNSPFAGPYKGAGLSVAGTNNRYNSFQIDGTVSNDVFGLSNSGTNGGKAGANPISMDAIQEVQLVIAPFDVRQGGFTGGGINAITKQGDNTFKGSAYAYYNDENFWGKYNATKDWEENKLNDQTTKTYGVSFGGPIIKDKLFFFANIENRKENIPGTIFPGFANNYISSETANQIINKYDQLTGNKDHAGMRNVGEDQLSGLARIDWNINDNHKLVVRYQFSNANKEMNASTMYSYTFSNSSYKLNSKNNSVVAELSSRISDVLHNELRISGSFVNDNRTIPYQGPNVEIKEVTTADGKGEVTARIGTDFSSGANWLDQSIYTIEDNLSWYMGDHNLTFGTHNELYSIQNMFIQASNGSWSFNSLDDFMNNKPNKFIYKYTDPKAPSTGGSSLWTPLMNFLQLGFYAQDKWTINNNFDFTYGLRFDIPMALNKPTENADFNKFAQERGIQSKVGETPSAKIMVSPRIGFNWYLNDDRTSLLRGGAGIFTGRVPFVWLSNIYTNNGVEQKGTTIYGDKSPALGKYTPEQLVELANSGSSGRPDIVTADKSFRFPQVIRGNIAYEHRLPGGIDLTLEGIYSKTMNNVLFENLALTKAGNVNAIEGVSASAIPYYTNNTGAYNTIINLKNTNKGYSYALSAMLEKTFDFGLNVVGSYTYGRSKSVNDGTSFVSYSNWKYNYSMDPNSGDELGFSKFDVPHRVMVSMSYTTPKYLNGLMQTNIGLVYNGYSGSRYSLTMADVNDSKDFNGDGYEDNNLLYIPTEAELEKMNFTKEEERKAFGDWIATDDYAKDHRGQFAERNSNLTPWENRLDLHIDQSIFYLKERGRKVQITFDVMNFANMLNKEWGAQFSAPYNVAPVKVSIDENRKATFQTNKASQINRNDIFSRWQAQLGLRVTF